MSERICVDLNGVLDTYDGWRGEPTWHPPREGAREFLAALCARGREVVVLTTRDPGEARAWLEEHDLDRYVADVTDRKLPALAYVDDRGVPFRGSFEETLAALDRFRPFWERTDGGNEDGRTAPAPDGREPDGRTER